MPTRPRILLVDDDQDLLDLYREILSQLPSRPEIATSVTGARAMAMLEAETFSLLVCDLNMPKMDGLQVLSIVRRKYPGLRTVVLTSVVDEQFRSRAYALGVDLFWQKPTSGEEIKQFLECLESLMGREDQSGGFRGVQSKSLVDIIQLECLSNNSTVLKITYGSLTGKIWVDCGDVIDAATDELSGEAAFHKILAWPSGNFESLPAEPGHPRTIVNSYQGLLLESAQAQDEAARPRDTVFETKSTVRPAADSGPPSRLTPLVRFPGVEFVMAFKPGAEKSFDARGLDNPQPLADWSRQNLERFRSLGDRLRAGLLDQVEAFGPQRNVALTQHGKTDFCVGWKHDTATREMRESMVKMLALWVS